MSGHLNRLDVRVGIEIDMISVMGSKFTWVVFWIEIGVVPVWGSKLTRIFSGVKIDFVSVCWPKIAWF